ncbi:MAG: hypothetical protein U5L11_01275 [Arhodomonas sp.]|nr:hypothetical protein [Arhodomonas sp.]
MNLREPSGCRRQPQGGGQALAVLGDAERMRRRCERPGRGCRRAGRLTPPQRVVDTARMFSGAGQSGTIQLGCSIGRADYTIVDPTP